MYWAGKENTNRVGVRLAPSEQRRTFRTEDVSICTKGRARRERDSGAFWEPVRGEEGFLSESQYCPNCECELGFLS